MSKRFGNYEILKKLATGGMAEIFLAKQTSLGGFERLVVVKRILPHLNEQEEFIKMFQDEARIVANLNHPNVAQIYDIGEVDDTYYIAMEYVRGEDLRRVYNQEVARGRAMPLEPAGHIVMGAAAGLDYAHRQTSISGRPLGIVHRDVSPQNILVTYDGHVKLVDFGVAKAEGKLTETRSGVLKGKYSYMSPEQASGDPIDGRTDVFALGITLYEITTGVRLFKRDSEIETLHAVIECNVTAPASLVPGYDSEMEAVVMRALAHEPDDRYQTAGDVERDLERFLVKRGHPTSASSLGAYMQDLFAEKLADELLFGGQPWEENLTPSRQARTSKLAPEKAEASARSSRSGWSKSNGSEDTEISKPAPENTVLEPVPSGERQSKSGPKSVWGAPDDWATTGEGALATATQGVPIPRGNAPIVAPTAPVPALDTNRSAAPPKEHPLMRHLPAIAVAVLILGLAISAALVLTSRRRGHDERVRSGMLAIDSEPRGARVVFVGPGAEELNSRYQGHRTPFTVGEGIPVENALRARFIKDGYEIPEVALPNLGAGVVPEPLFVELPAMGGSESGALVVLSEPKGADVYVDGNKVAGVTPMNDVRVKGGEMHKVEFHLTGYKPRWETVYVEPGSRRFVEVTLFADEGAAAAKPTEKPADAGTGAGNGASAETDDDDDGQVDKGDGGKSFLTVTSPLKLKVSIDNRFVGETPVKKLAVDSGVRRLRLVSDAEGFTLRRKVRLAAGRTETIDIKPLKGNLAANATPWAWVRVGKASPAETPVRLTVYEGEYVVQFECPDGKRKRDTAKVTPGKTASVSVNCRD
ncbi:MAG: protein kinase [Deltaproteobacteria bacterium]|nr:protein kinase [Deltaproteobacteria bacterium]